MLCVLKGILKKTHGGQWTAARTLAWGSRSQVTWQFLLLRTCYREQWWPEALQVRKWHLWRVDGCCDRVPFWSTGRIGLTCGHLIYYDDKTRQSVEDKVHMPEDCINICMGHECWDIQLPDGKPEDCMLQIVGWDGETISLCAESTGDCLAWKFTFQDYVGLCWLRSHVWWDSCGFLPTFLHRLCCTNPWAGIGLWSIQWCIPTRNSSCLYCKCSGLCCTLSVPVCRTLWTAACQPRHHLWVVLKQWQWPGVGHAGWSSHSHGLRVSVLGLLESLEPRRA